MQCTPPRLWAPGAGPASVPDRAEAQLMLPALVPRVMGPTPTSMLLHFQSR